MNPITQKIASVAEMEEEATALAAPEPPPDALLEQLLEKRLFPDAARFLAHALPKREAVWWAWICAKRSAGEAAAPLVKGALEATERWVAQPTEPNRRAAKDAADELGLDKAAGCAGLAAYFSSGSLAPPEAPVVPPGEYLTAKAVAGAVILAAVTPDPAQAQEKFQAYLAQGMDVARRLKLWETAQTAPQ